MTTIEPSSRRGSDTGSAGRPTDATARTTMLALVQRTYGAPEVLRSATVPMPTPGPGQVRVRVGASSVNARDWHVMRGEPRMARLLDRRIFGLRAPKLAIRGTDFAGTVDATGPDVTQWQPGDRILGEADGAWAEYVIAAQDAIAAIPRAMSFEQAAALPLAGTTALTCLSAGQPQAGDQLLINGASGGVGTFAVQMAHTMGLRITAVCSARNADQARALGADTVVDYAVEDFCGRPDRYDMVLDLVGNRPVRALRRLLRPTGTLVLSGGGVPGAGRYVGPLALLVRAQLLARRPGPRIVVPQAQPTTGMLMEIAALVQSGTLTPVIDRIYALNHGADAVRYVETEHARGKVIITIVAT
jgi:NADPH:quinone reductase-like Zn-dependent oxidoreductase